MSCRRARAAIEVGDAHDGRTLSGALTHTHTHITNTNTTCIHGPDGGKRPAEVSPSTHHSLSRTPTRQGKRTPRLYLLQLEDWAAVVNQDDTLEDITGEQIFFKFKTTIWVSLQDEITAILRRDKCDGRERDLKTINKYLELVEHLYDEAVKKQNDEAKTVQRKQIISNKNTAESRTHHAW